MLFAKIMQDLLEASRVALERGNERGFIPIEFREKSFERDWRIHRRQPVLSALFRRLHHNLALSRDTLSVVTPGHEYCSSIRNQQNHSDYPKFGTLLNDDFNVF